MLFTVPRYMQAANIQDQTIRYLWDDWDVERAEEPIDDDFLEQLRGISQRAVIAFVNGSAEWIVHRFGKLADTTLPRQYLAAAWAQIVDWRYAAYNWEERAVKGEWIGPVKGPLGIAMTRVKYAIDEAKENGFPELRGAWIANLAPYIMTKPGPYLEWRAWVIQRLTTLYTRNPDETLGDVVPRETLDPDSNFQPNQTEALVNRFLAGLDSKTNPFLKSPKKMLEEGFEGTPYVFDIEKERQKRLLES